MRKRKWISYLLVCTVLSMYAPLLPVQAAEKAKLAIYPLNSRRVNNDTLATAENALRASISGVGSFDLLSRDEVNKIIANEGLAPVCDTDECLAGLAKTLDVELLVTGNISKMGAIYLINLRLFDALAERTINSSEMTCSLENTILAFALTSAGSNLVDVERPEPVSTPPPAVVMTADVETPAAEIIEENIPAEPAEETVEAVATEPLAKEAVSEEETPTPPTGSEPAIVASVEEHQKTIPPPEPPAVIAEAAEVEETPAAEPAKGIEPVIAEKVEALPAKTSEEVVAEEEIQVVSEPETPAVVASDVVEDDEAPGSLSADGKMIDEPLEETKPAGQPGSRQKMIIYSSLGAVVVGGALAVTQISEANSNYVKESQEVENSDEAKAFLSKAESASNIARAGIAIAGIGVAVAVYSYLKGGEPKSARQTPSPKYLPELKLASCNLSLSWRF